MKYQSLAVAAIMVAAFGTCAVAQSSEKGAPRREPAPFPWQEGRLGDKGGSRVLESLSPEMRERFQAVREKALDDPKLRELRWNAERANREFYKAMREKMLQIDPGLAEIVRKRSIEWRARKLWRDEGVFPSLSDAEREKLMNVLEQVENDPAVQAANKRRLEAKSADEGNAAADDYRKTLREAMAKVDPTIAPILDRLGPGEASAETVPAGKQGR